jgi:hypothetical protein
MVGVRGEPLGVGERETRRRATRQNLRHREWHVYEGIRAAAVGNASVVRGVVL